MKVQKCVSVVTFGILYLQPQEEKYMGKASHDDPDSISILMRSSGHYEHDEGAKMLLGIMAFDAKQSFGFWYFISATPIAKEPLARSSCYFCSSLMPWSTRVDNFLGGSSYTPCPWGWGFVN